MRISNCWSWRKVTTSLLLLLAGCTYSHQAVFDEAAFKATAGSGSGVVTGRAYATWKHDEIHPANGISIDLAPVNAFTTESIQLEFVQGRKVKPDPRLVKYLRSTTCDANGNFTIRHVPPGQYYLATFVDWEYRYDSENADNTGTEEMVAQFKKPIFTKITVGQGQTVRVTQWNQNCPNVGPLFAHGG